MVAPVPVPPVDTSSGGSVVEFHTQRVHWGTRVRGPNIRDAYVRVNLFIACPGRQLSQSQILREATLVVSYGTELANPNELINCQSLQS